MAEEKKKRKWVDLLLKIADILLLILTSVMKVPKVLFWVLRILRLIK